MGAAITCTVCPHACRLAPGQHGRCRARVNAGGAIVAGNYGRVTSLALDPIEKKPIARWRAGSWVVSVGSYGCNLACPFCQNHEISQAAAGDLRWREIAPDELVAYTAATRAADPSTIGIAYTYNEPLVGWEYVRDCARLAHEAGLVNVLVSNGCVLPGALDELDGLIEAANIDLKGFSADFYDACGAGPGALDAVKGTIERLAADPRCHLEVTTEFVTRDNVPEEVDLGKLPEDASETLRLVRVGDYDTCACIGAHVGNTREIGHFKIISSDYADGKWRVRFKLENRK